MSTQRDELAEIIMSIAVRPDLLDYRGDYESGAVCFGDAQRIADKVIAAGYHTPRVITDLVELDALDFGSIIHMKNVKAPFLLTDEGWESTSFPGKPVWDYTSNPDYLPATVLYEPTA